MSDTPPACVACGQPIQTLDDFGGSCIVCSNLFCARHVVIRNGVANCAACEHVRRRREASGPISQPDTDRVIRLLQHDLVETIGPGHEMVVTEAAARLRFFSDEPADFEQRVADDVQQCLHDTFVDTSWPACPEHPNHPLWYSGGWWRCEKSGRRAAALGELPGKAGLASVASGRLADRFVGTWRLVSFLERGADSRETNTYGSNPRGLLIYDKGGRMSVQIARSDGTPVESAAAYFGYFGRYTVDESAGTVTHHIEGSSLRNFVGTDQRRFFTLANDRLVLSTARERTGGSDVTYVATWERLR